MHAGCARCTYEAIAPGVARCCAADDRLHPAGDVEEPREVCDPSEGDRVDRVNDRVEPCGAERDQRTGSRIAQIPLIGIELLGQRDGCGRVL